MDFNHARRLSGFAGLVLAAICRIGVGAEAYVADSAAPTTLIVTATDAEQAVPAPPASMAAQLVIRTAEAGAPAVGDPAASAQGSLTVVANAAQPATPLVVTNDPAVAPAASVEAIEGTRLGGISSWQSRAGSSAARTGTPLKERFSALEALTGNEPPRRSYGQSAQQPTKRPNAQRAKYRDDSEATSAEPAAPIDAAEQGVETAAAHDAVSPVTPAGGQPPLDPAVALVAEAHKLSLKASTQGEYSQIIKLCSQAANRGLDGESLTYGRQLSSWALNRRGQIRADEGLGELAMADFRSALEFDANNWRALHNRGVTLAQSGEFAEAFDDICRVIELKPDFAKAYSNRATLYVQASDFDKALSDYDQAIKYDAKLTPAHVGRGRVRHMQGRLHEALGDLTAAVALAPKDAEIVCSRADLLADLGRYSDALTDYARAIELNSKFEHAFRNGAWLLATCPDDKVRDADGALDGAKAALGCGYGERHAALDTMAAALANAGRFKEAMSTIDQAIAIAPDDLRPAYEARQALYKQSQPFRTRPVNEVQTAGFEGE